MTPTLSDQAKISQLLLENVETGGNHEFRASWVAKRLGIEPSVARVGLVWFAHPPSGAAWLEAHLRLRCKEHDRPIEDIVEGAELKDEYVCTGANEALSREEIYSEVYFAPTPALLNEAKKKSLLLHP